MIVGLDAKRAYHNATGLGVYARGVLRALSAHAPSLRLVAYTPPRRPGRPAPVGAWDVREPTSALARTFPAVWRQAGLHAALRRDAVEVFHGLSAELPLGLDHVGVAGVVTIHDLIWERFPELYRAPDRLVYRAKARSAVARARVVVAVSGQTRDDLVALYGVPREKIRVVYQGTDLAFQAAPPRPDEDDAVVRARGLERPYVLQVGTVEPRKNLLATVRAISELPAVDLVVVGRETPYGEEVRVEAARLGVAARLRFLSGVPGEELASLYRRAAAVAYPSFYEGFGIPIVEALFCGAPVVTSRGGCFEEAGGPGAVYVDPARPEELRAALATILGDAGRSAELRARGRAHVERFRDEAIARALVEAYEGARRA